MRSAGQDRGAAGRLDFLIGLIALVGALLAIQLVFAVIFGSRSDWVADLGGFCTGLVLSILWLPAMAVVYYHYGWVLFFIPSIPAHYRMARGQLA